MTKLLQEWWIGWCIAPCCLFSFVHSKQANSSACVSRHTTIVLYRKLCLQYSIWSLLACTKANRQTTTRTEEGKI